VTDINSFVQRIIVLHPALQRAIARACSESSPLAVPITVLMGEIADALSAGIEEFSIHDRREIFATLEEELCNGEETAKNAIATGFLESLQAKASSGEFDFREIAAYLGKHSKAYCTAWDNYTGVATPGLHDNSLTTPPDCSG